MNNVDSKKTLITWIYAFLTIVGCAVTIAIKGLGYGIGPGAGLGVASFWACFMTIVLNCLVFTEKKKTATILYVVGGVVLIALSHLFFLGIVFLPLIKRRYYLGAIGLAAGLAAQVVFERVGELALMGEIAILVGVFVLWMLFNIVTNRVFAMEETLSDAVRTSALDGLHEKMLREQIGKQQSLKEMNARLEERERISRDIHNSVGHTLSAASVTLDAATMLISKDPELASDKVSQANDRVHNAIESIRSAVRTLDADDGRMLMKDYISSLKDLCGNFCLDTNVKVHSNLEKVYDDAQEDGKIDLDTASFLSGVLSELLTNGTKHGGATFFVVMLTMDDGNIGLKVSDNGCGWGEISYDEKSARLSRGFGLRKMRDYCETKGGSFDINGEDGFTVSLNVPRRVGE